jgi:hypothetical protein
MKRPSAVLLCAFCEAIRAIEGNMPDDDKRNGGRHEDGGTGLVWVIQ